MDRGFQSPQERRKLRRLPPLKRVLGERRAKLAAEMADAYNKGASIRRIVQESGRSYGFVHRVLSERGDVTFRTRGGAVRGKR